jgi:hypothetical protein
MSEKPSVVEAENGHAGRTQARDERGSSRSLDNTADVTFSHLDEKKILRKVRNHSFELSSLVRQIHLNSFYLRVSVQLAGQPIQM